MTPDQKAAIIAFHEQFPCQGYRRLTFMMIDMDIAHVAPATTYRILKAAGRLERWQRERAIVLLVNRAPSSGGSARRRRGRRAR